MKANIVLKKFILCPHCGKGEDGISHLSVGRSFGPWYCDECGHSYVGKVTEDGADLKLWHEVKIERKVMLRYVYDNRLKFVVDGSSVFRSTPEDDKYYYDEHTCPSNIMRDVIDVIFNEEGKEPDTDPHGLFEFVEVLK